MKGGNMMKAILKKIIDAIAGWLYGPPCTYTPPCCDKEVEDKDKGQDKKPGGFIY